ncbi:MAG: acetylglutamate kinase [Candidatus Omnitrophica bacterium]|nr:acetylglutamate kinase [Candidatus Omnitrophota bacterium]
MPNTRPKPKSVPGTLYPVRKKIAVRIPAAVVRKADTLLEALPYLQSFRGKTVVVKYGGSVIANAPLRRSILQDIVFLSVAGIRPVLVHGGGPEISKQMSRKGKPPRFVQGLRVTDAETLKMVIQALSGVNRMLVKELKALGARAQGLLGSESGLVRAEPYTIPGEELGFVGMVTGVNTGPVQRLLALGVIPVVVPVGAGWDHQAYNVNADETAAALAAGLKAEKFVLMTDVPGILTRREDPRSFLSTVTAGRAQELIRKGVIGGGMIPKAKACMHALQGGVRKTHMIDAEVPHALLLEIFTQQGIGTEIVKR